MASIGLLGFAKGASKVALDRMEAREEAEREVKKQEALERLRMETAKELADYNRTHNPNEAMTSVDYESGKVTTRNAKGEVIGERAVTAAERAEEEAKRKKASLDEQDTLSQIRYREGQLANDRARIAAERERTRTMARSGGRGLGGADDEEDVSAASIAGVFMDSHSKTIEDLTKRGVPREVIMEAAYDLAASGVAAKGNLDEYNREFNRTLTYFGNSLDEEGVFNPDRLRAAARAGRPKKPTAPRKPASLDGMGISLPKY